MYKASFQQSLCYFFVAQGILFFSFRLNKAEDNDKERWLNHSIISVESRTHTFLAVVNIFLIGIEYFMRPSNGIVVFIGLCISLLAPALKGYRNLRSMAFIGVGLMFHDNLGSSEMKNPAVAAMVWSTVACCTILSMDLANDVFWVSQDCVTRTKEYYTLIFQKRSNMLSAMWLFMQPGMSIWLWCTGTCTSPIILGFLATFLALLSVIGVFNYCIYPTNEKKQMPYPMTKKQLPGTIDSAATYQLITSFHVVMICFLIATVRVLVEERVL